MHDTTARFCERDDAIVGILQRGGMSRHEAIQTVYEQVRGRHAARQAMRKRTTVTIVPAVPAPARKAEHRYRVCGTTSIGQRQQAAAVLV